MRTVRHHIRNRINKGHSVPENLLTIKEDKEKLIHKIFGNLDFYDIILVLIRLSRMKHYERVNPKIAKFYMYLK